VHSCLWETHRRTTERHLPYEITQCYLPLETQMNAPAVTPARQAGTRFTYLEGMEGWVDLGAGYTPTSIRQWIPDGRSASSRRYAATL